MAEQAYKHQTGKTWQKGGNRVAYFPEWDSSNPYITYSYGTAGGHFDSLQAAWKHLTGKSIPEDWDCN